MVVGEGQGQGLPLLPGKMLLAGSNGFQTPGSQATSACALGPHPAHGAVLGPGLCPSLISLSLLHTWS